MRLEGFDDERQYRERIVDSTPQKRFIHPLVTAAAGDEGTAPRQLLSWSGDSHPSARARVTVEPLCHTAPNRRRSPEQQADRRAGRPGLRKGHGADRQGSRRNKKTREFPGVKERVPRCASWLKT
jgi:hypothetical protein